MKTLPNGVTVFNATPHSIRFWREGWEKAIVVETDQVINAKVTESPYRGTGDIFIQDHPKMFIRINFTSTHKGRKILFDAYVNGADIVVGSIIAAQAYPGIVVAMTPAPGYKRVKPSEKRMNPDKFTVF